jgi:hypothetical protein
MYILLFYAQQRMVGRVPGDLAMSFHVTKCDDFAPQELCWLQSPMSPVLEKVTLVIVASNRDHYEKSICEVTKVARHVRTKSSDECSKASVSR